MESGDFNKNAAVFGARCGTKRSSRDICISSGHRTGLDRERPKVCKEEIETEKHEKRKSQNPIK